jgi:hypothetical protein
LERVGEGVKLRAHASYTLLARPFFQREKGERTKNI